MNTQPRRPLIAVITLCLWVVAWKFPEAARANSIEQFELDRVRLEDPFFRPPNSPKLQPQGMSNPVNQPSVPNEAIHLILRLSERRVYLYTGDQVTVSFPVAIGRAGWATPTGAFKVMAMYKDPSWKNPFTGAVIPPGPKNPLGLRWIGFWTDGNNWVGFHGTPNPHLIGQAVSHGCVRMHNEDIVKLFAQVQVGTPVVVKP